MIKKSILTAIVLLFAFTSFAQLKLPKVIASNMVLQRNQPVPIWGWAKPNEMVTVSFKGQQMKTLSDANGYWKVMLSSLSASNEPAEMVISASNTISLTNILVGEVWLVSGQSNMEYPMKHNYAKPRRSVDSTTLELSSIYPEIRLFKVEKVLSDTLTTTGWNECTDSKVIGDFSAIGYYFARNLTKELKVPIGILEAAWGGTRIEPWTTEEMYASLPAFKDLLVQKPGTISGAKVGKHYQSMVKPLVPFALKGVLWYQGESNVMINDDLFYADKVQALIEGWRKAWGTEMSFYSVGLAPYYYTKRKDVLPHTSETLAKFWEAQLESLKIPNTAMVWTTDLVDNLSDIHPPYKWTVAERLSDLALNRDYKRNNLIAYGPTYQSIKIKKNKVYLSLRNAKGLKSSDGKTLTWFTIAGKDGEFVAADAIIEGEKIVLSSPKVDEPLQVRFAWHEEAQSNLVNGAGLPAVPFRTDQAVWDYKKSN